jgi:uncharacterized protein HemY
MTKWFQWIVLTSITGSPLASILILIVFWWLVDRFTLGMLPDPLRGWARWQRATKLRATLDHNPHDRRARRELGDILVQQRRFQEASEVLKPSLEAGDDDLSTLFLGGVAFYGAGQHETGERLLEAARAREPGFRMGSIDLELGRGRLARGDLPGAREALERFCQARPSTVEGKVLLARAIKRAGDPTKSAELRAQAWKDYASAPVFKRRRERYWAWRANPSRPLLYLALALAVAILFSQFGALGLHAPTTLAD